MELKRFSKVSVSDSIKSFNRTFMELKRTFSRTAPLNTAF